MLKRSDYLPYFVFFLVISLIIFFVSKTGILKPVNSFFQSFLSPFQAITYDTFSKVSNFSTSPKLKALQDEENVLTKKLIDEKRLISDNKALRDQFQTQNPVSTSLLPAQVIGAPGFIPGVSAPETLILDKGERDGVRVGDGVVYQNNLVGKISQTSIYFSSVMLIVNSGSSFTAKTLDTQNLGVVKGQGGGEVILDNVLLSGTLKKGDIVLTKGDISEEGSGFVPDLVVGKIISVSKNPSDLFQKAEIKSMVDFSNLDKVFVQTRL